MASLHTTNNLNEIFAQRAEGAIVDLINGKEADNLSLFSTPSNYQIFLEVSLKEILGYGLGWMFISQTLSSLHKEIVEQLRIMFFGFGLALGTEFQALRELVGGDPNALKLYQSFRDPHSSFNEYSREYAFMTIGPISPLSFSGTPLFFTAFNKPDDFLHTNGIETEKT